MKRFAPLLILACLLAGLPARAAGIMYTNEPQPMANKTIVGGLRFLTNAAAPPAPANAHSLLYMKDLGGVPVFFYKDQAGVEHPLVSTDASGMVQNPANFSARASGSQSEIQFRDPTTGSFSSESSLGMRMGGVVADTNITLLSVEGQNLGIGNITVGGGPWKRLGKVLAGNADAIDNRYAAEPTCLFDTNAVLFPSATPVIKVWFSVGASVAPGIAYAESTNGIDFVRYPGKVILNHQRGTVFRNGPGDYWWFGVRFSGNPTDDQRGIDRYTSPDGVNWTLAQSDVVYLTNQVVTDVDGNSFRWALGNANVFRDDSADEAVFGTGTNIVYALYFDYVTNYGSAVWFDAVQLSTNGTSWADPVPVTGTAVDQSTGIQDASFGFIHAQTLVPSGVRYYTAWAHGSWQNSQTVGPNGVPSDIYKFYSRDLTNWSKSTKNLHPDLARATYDDGAFSGVGQVADPTLCEAWGKTFIYYDSLQDQASTSGTAKIKAAVAEDTMDNVALNVFPEQLVVPGWSRFMDDLTISPPIINTFGRDSHAVPELGVVGPSPMLTLMNLSTALDRRRFTFQTINSGVGISFADELGTTRSFPMWFERTGSDPNTASTAYFNATQFSFAGYNSYFPFKLVNTYPGAHEYAFYTYGDGTTIQGSFGLNDSTVGANRLAVDSLGQFGIGTQNQAAQLHVYSTNAAAVRVESLDVSTYPVNLTMFLHRDQLLTNVVAGVTNIYHSPDNLANGDYGSLSWWGFANSQWSRLASMRGLYGGDGTTKFGQIDMYTMTNGVEELIASFTATNIVFWRPLELRGPAGITPGFDSLKVTNALTAGSVAVTNLNGTSFVVPPPPSTNIFAGGMPSRLAWGPSGFYWQNPRNTVTWYDEFEGATVSGSTIGFNNSSSGGGYANTLGSSSPIAGAYGGVLAIGAGTSNPGYGIVQGNNHSVWFGVGRHYWEARVQIPILSTSTERQDYVVGYSDRGTSTNTTDGVYFRICDLTNSFGLTSGTNWVNSTATANAWECWASNNGTHSFVGTATVPNAATWYTLGMDFAADGSSVKYYVDGTCIATNTTNIPITSTRGTTTVFGGFKYVGSTQRYMYVDYATATTWLTTSR